MNNVRNFANKPLREIFQTATPVHVPRTSSLLSIIELMSQKNIGCVVVVDEKKPIGIFTERDLLKRVVAKVYDLAATRVEAVMTAPPMCISNSATLLTVMSIMHMQKFRHLVITNDQGEVAGVISLKDVLSLMTNVLS